METKLNSIEMTLLRRSRVHTIAEGIVGSRANFNMICRIAENNVVCHLRCLYLIYRDGNMPDPDTTIRIYESSRKQWHKVELLTSRQIRAFFNTEQCITDTKLMSVSVTHASALYKKISRLCNIGNKTKLLRLLHGDVYCGSRLYQFGLTDTDMCIRCFDRETRRHLLLECPYTKEVWSRLGLSSNSAQDILRSNITQEELEIIADLISAIVFRKQVIPPEVLIRTTMFKFRDGLSKRKKTRLLATNKVSMYEFTGQWFT
jgi:hypothetical protein